MLGSSLAVGAVCCARDHLAFTLRAVLRELFTISVCVALCGPALFCAFINCCPVFMLPSSRNCHATTGLEGSVCVWGLRPMANDDERCALKPMHPSLHYCNRIHEHVPPMPSCAQVPLPSAVLTSAGAFRSDRTARVSAVASGAGFAAPPYATAFPSYRVYQSYPPTVTDRPAASGLRRRALAVTRGDDPATTGSCGGFDRTVAAAAPVKVPPLPSAGMSCASVCHRQPIGKIAISAL
jgi:hypothetical protein